MGITEYSLNWIKKGWKRSDGKPVKNVDLWKLLIEASGRHTVDWQWVKGHSGDEGNERADELAGMGLPQNLTANYASSFTASA